MKRLTVRPAVARASQTTPNTERFLMIQSPAQLSPPRNRTLEDIAVRFLNNNAGKIYFGLSVLTLMVVAVKEQWV